jgi:alpha-1,3-rhamnosyltransferase
MKQKTLPLVTLAISAYNHEQYITQSLLSLINQTYPNIELIVFDDGSSDKTADTIKSIQKQHPFYFEERENAGLTPTLNAILSRAKGKYFSVLGSDDIAMLDKTEKQVALMEQDDSLGLCGGNILEIDQLGIIQSRQRFHSSHQLDFKSIILNEKPGITAPTLFFKTEILRSVGGFCEEIRLEDLYITLKITEAGHQVSFMNDLLAYYRVHPQNTYKNLDYMSKNIIATLNRFKSSPYYSKAYQKTLTSLFLKSAKNNKPLAKKLLKQINFSEYSLKVCRGLVRMYLS